jgi:hypothetical protein
MIRRLSIVAIAAVAAACSQPEEPAASTEPAAPAAPSPVSQAYVAEVQDYWSGGAAVTAEEVIGLVGLNGPAGAIEALGDDQPRSRWNTVMSGIASADPAWLSVAAALEPGVSGPSAEALDWVLKAALAADATATLRVLESARQRLSPQTVCASDEAETVAALRPSVDAVSDPALEAKKAACLEAMGG